MGVSNSREIVEGVDVFDRGEYDIIGSYNSIIGTVQEIKRKADKSVWIIKSKMVDCLSDGVIVRLKFVGKDKANCVRLMGVGKIDSSSGWCATSIFELRIPVFKTSVYEIKKAEIRRDEGRIWMVVMDVLKVG